MKKVFTFLVAVFLTATVFAQSPEKMSYQAVIRNSSDALVTNTQVGMQISILQGSASGTAVYVETQTPTSNSNGLVSLEIGTGTIVSGDFSTIDWTDGPYFMQTETDPAGGTTYSITGISQLLSVPYALHAITAETVTGSITETDPVFTAWDKSTGISITESQISDLGNYIETETQNLDDVLTINNSAGNKNITNLADPIDAQDAATRIYVDESAPVTYEIGDEAHGGIVFYVEACGTKGLVAATEDNSTGIKWRGGGLASNYSIMARGDEIYAGKMNTSIIIAVHSAKNDFDDHAASICANYTGGDFGDWYLPSIKELILMYNNLHTQGLGGFTNNWYWSSSEANNNNAGSFTFTNGNSHFHDKYHLFYVRAVRAF
jgi:hypothetical protein